MKKDLQEMVWPVENYTDKIHSGIKMMFQLRHWITFTIPQMKEHLVKGYPWLANPTTRQTELLDKIIKTGIQKLTQLGKVKKVTSSVSVESQWQWASDVVENDGFTNVTSEDSVAQTDEAKKAAGRRSIGGRTLWQLNGRGKFGLLH
jgi:hypothetical protein